MAGACKRRPPPSLLALEEERRFLAQHRQQTFRRLFQEPRQRHLDAQSIFQHFDRTRGALTERAHVEAQGVALPRLGVDRDHRSELALAARKAVFQAAHGLSLAKMMADRDRDGIAHGETRLPYLVACATSRRS